MYACTYFLNDLGLNVVGGGVVGSFSIKKSMLDGCGYWERCGFYLYVFLGSVVPCIVHGN